MTPSRRLADLALSICGPLALMFITLKLLGVITWSWWWVLAPLVLLFVAGLCFVAYLTHGRRV